MTTDASATNAPHATKKPWWRNPLRALYHWVLSWADTPYGTPALVVLSFAESSFFPIPPDVLQIALSVARPKRSFYYALVSMLASVAGGVAGYYLGFAFWSVISDFFFNYVPGFSKENFDFVKAKYEANAFAAIFMAAFTPIPYKVFTVAAGVFQVSLGTLVLASTLGRGGRFFAVATCIHFAGPKVKELLEKYFEVATLAVGILLIVGFLAIKYFVG